MQNLSIIIPSCNRPQRLQELLDCLILASELYQNLIQEIIVVSDGSKAEFFNEYQAICQHKLVKYYFFVQGRGPSFARNFGASKALGDWLWFLDDDLKPKSESLGFLDQFKPDLNVIAYYGITLVDKDSSFSDQVPSRSDFTAGYGSGNFLVQKTSFYTVGGFDQNYFRRRGRLHFREDTDLGLRLLKLGEIVSLPELLCLHPKSLKADKFFILKDAKKYWFESYFLKQNQEGRAYIGSPFKKGKLGTYQLRGFISDLILLSYLSLIFINTTILLIAFYILLAYLLFRKIKLKGFDYFYALIISLLYPFFHSLYYLKGYLALAKRQRSLYSYSNESITNS